MMILKFQQLMMIMKETPSTMMKKSATLTEMSQKIWLIKKMKLLKN